MVGQMKIEQLGEPTPQQEGEALGLRSRERAHIAQTALDEDGTREDALRIHKALARDVMRDVVETCVRTIVRYTLQEVIKKSDLSEL